MHPPNHFHRGDLLSYSSKFEIKESYLWLPRKAFCLFFFQFFNWEEGKQLLFKWPFNCIEVLVNKLDISPHSEKKLNRLCTSLSVERKGEGTPSGSLILCLESGYLLHGMALAWVLAGLQKLSWPQPYITFLYFRGHIDVTQCVILSHRCPSVFWEGFLCSWIFNPFQSGTVSVILYQECGVQIFDSCFM